jgi:hypothetical protein
VPDGSKATEAARQNAKKLTLEKKKEKKTTLTLTGLLVEGTKGPSNCKG